MPEPLSLDLLRRAVAERLELPAESVGDATDLLELGLDSIGLMRLAAQWAAAGSGVTFAELIEHRTLAEWWDLMRPDAAPQATEPAALVEVDEAAPFALATMQHAYWVGRTDGQLLGGVGAHFYSEFDGAGIDTARLEGALAILVRHHPMLRARFLADGTQQITPAAAHRLAVRDLRGLPAAEVAAELDRVRDRLSHGRLDAARGEVLDVSVSLLPGGAARLHVKIEMLVADAHSFRVLLADLAALYRRPGEPLPEVSYSYPRYLANEAIRRAEEREAARAYWQDRLPSFPAGPELPIAKAPERITSPRVARHYHWLTAGEWSVLADRAREHGVTLPMVFLTAFAEVLAAWSVQSRFVLNLPLYDRQPHHPDVDRLVGDFTSLLLLEVDAAGDRGFAERVRAVRHRFAADVAHSAYSGVEVLRDLARARGEQATSVPVVFTSAISLGELFGEDVRACFGEPGWTTSQTPQVWLDCQVTEREGGLFVNWDVVEELFPEGVVDAMFTAYVALLDWLRTADWTAEPPAPIPAAQIAVRAAANGVLGPVSGQLLHDGFFAQAAREPGRVAVLGEKAELTYGELAESALRLAALLKSAGVEPGDTVGIRLPKGASQVIAALGVLAAGATYVPVGVDQPPLRRARILARAGARVLVAEPGTDLTEGTSAEQVRVVTLLEAEDHEPLAEPAHVDDEATAYVIFTSGSTGEPKGVEVPHRAAVNTIEDIRRRFGIGPADRTLAISALDFDLSVFDIFAPLGAGGAVVVIGEDQRRDPHAWLELVREHGVTIWQTVPALLDMVLVAAEDEGRSLGAVRLALLGGDWVGLDLRDRLVARNPGARLIALGGTTETAIHSSVFEVTEVPEEWRSIPYGRPLRNQLFRVVDERGRDRPDWVAGELWIGGTSVACGYRGDPERTADRFVEVDGVRWYRTGDLGRYWPDGTLEFLGRADHQVKVGGHRIELGEVETALAACPGIRDAVAVKVGDPAQLAAVVAGKAESEEAIQDFLRDRLPSYMIPQQIEVVESFPLSANGKIDRRAVQRLAESRRGAAGRTVEPPQGRVETALAALWADLLGVAAAGRDDGFFALGGDSLLATRLLGRLRAAGLHGGDLRALFAHPRLRDFAALLRPGAPTGQAALSADPEHRHDPFPPTDVQRAYWMGRSGEFALGAVGSHWYWEFDGAGIDLARLEDAWNVLVQRHEMLRAVFDPDGMQRILPEVGRTGIPVTDATGPDALEELRERLAHRIPDPTRWPVVAIEAVRYGDDRLRIAFSFDYILLDALSIVTVFAELAKLYRDPAAELPPVAVSFRDYVLSAGPDEPVRKADEDYWSDRLATLPPAPQLPLAKDPAQVVRPRFVRHETRLSQDQWQGLREKARTYGVTPASVLATAFAEVLSAWSSRADLTLNLTLFDRREVHPDIDHILGDFTSLLLAAHHPRPGDGWLDLVRRFQEQVWSGMEHNAVSAIWVLRELARHLGEPAVSMPVVFTSALGVSDELAGLRLPFGEQVWGISQTPQVWLDCQVMEREGGLYANWDVVEELFPEGVVDAMFAAFSGLLEWLVAEDWSGGLPELMPQRQRAVRAQVNDVPGPISGRLLHEGFFAWAAQEPGRPAVVGERVELSYGQVAEAALRLGAELKAAGVGVGDAVGVCLPKGAAQVVAVLGVLAAGGVYVPVGVDQPPVRRARIFERAGVRVAIGHSGAELGAAVRLVPLSDDELRAGVRPGSPAERGLEPLSEPVRIPDESPAYVIFTSGSTGEPKGVEVSHRAAVNTIEDVCDRFGVGADDRVLAVSALDFDLSVFDVFGLLAVGGAVVVIGEDQRRDPHAWLELVRGHGVTVWNTVPALLDMLLTVDARSDLGALRLAMVSGDWVGLDLRDRLVARSPGARLVALGGATEAAIWSNFFEVAEVPEGWRSIPYGTPLRNQRFRVVDERGRDRPDWALGELWIGGAGVASGYRGDPERTAERFVGHAGVRWYRTGDLGRYWPDGTLEFLGREDHQVKVGGHRIELGEIEAALADHPGVRDAVVVKVGDPARLAAVVVGKVESEEGVRDFLRDRLPPYMVPQQVRPVESLPLSANGKVDRSAIERLLAAGADDARAEPPRDGVEAELAALWNGLLNRQVTDRRQSFFALGGDSLLATRMVEAVRDRYGVEVPLRELFAQPALAHLAATIEEQVKDYEEGEL